MNNVQAIGFLRTAKTFIFLFVETFSQNGREFIIKRFGTYAPLRELVMLFDNFDATVKTGFLLLTLRPERGL